MKPEHLLDVFAANAVLPVLTPAERPHHAVQVATALRQGGLTCLEIALRTASAEQAIERTVRQCQDVVVGAGTVLTKDQAQHALAVGAQFLVAPGFDAHLVEWCQRHEAVMVPGVATATEINAALQLGVTLMKFFPAEHLGGVRTLRALHGPYPDVRFLPTGGITDANLGQYLELSYVVACGGSWIVEGSGSVSGSVAGLKEITRRAETARSIVRRMRPQQAGEQ